MQVCTEKVVGGAAVTRRQRGILVLGLGLGLRTKGFEMNVAFGRDAFPVKSAAGALTGC